MFSHVFSLFLLRPAQRDIKINLHRKWQKLAAQRGNSDSCNKLCQSVLFHRIQNPTTHCIRTMVHSTMWGLMKTSHNWFPLGLQRIYNRKVAQSPLAGGPPPYITTRSPMHFGKKDRLLMARSDSTPV